mgnify:CR=1 FL=1
MGERTAMSDTRVVNLRGNWSLRHHPDFMYIGRGVAGFRRSKWANPYPIGPRCTREESLAKYHKRLQGRPDLLAALPELRGKILACWCKPQGGFMGRLLCHGQILAGLADDVPPESIE